MPRESEPGERRGGRQHGTPNKKTALRNAALAAAAANPEILPLDFLLGDESVRDGNIFQHVHGSLSGKGTVPVTRNATPPPNFAPPRQHP